MARAPGFFRTLGFEEVEADRAPLFFRMCHMPSISEDMPSRDNRLEIKIMDYSKLLRAVLDTAEEMLICGQKRESGGQHRTYVRRYGTYSNHRLS